MINDLLSSNETTPSVKVSNRLSSIIQFPEYSVLDNVLVGKIVDEVFAQITDDRINTKHIIYEDISSTKNTQKQYERIIAACEQELRNKNISNERRNEILDCMIRMAESSDYAIRQSREFQHEQLDHLRKKSWIIAGTCLFLFCGTIFLKVTI